MEPNSRPSSKTGRRQQPSSSLPLLAPTPIHKKPKTRIAGKDARLHAVILRKRRPSQSEGLPTKDLCTLSRDRRPADFCAEPQPTLPHPIFCTRRNPMHVVLGASGNTGRVVAQNLLSHQQKVRVVGRDAAHLQSHAAQGAEIFIADVTDAAALTKAFQNADSAYVMIPPDPTGNDPLAYAERAGDAIATALKNAGVKNVVVLSSFGADKSQGTGPVLGLYKLEQKLNQLDGANILFLRPGYFMENTLAQVNVISTMGFVA